MTDICEADLKSTSVGDSGGYRLRKRAEQTTGENMNYRALHSTKISIVLLESKSYRAAKRQCNCKQFVPAHLSS